MDALLPRNFEPPWKAPRIAVLEISGQIGVQVRGTEMVRTIKGLANDARVRAVVVEIDSPWWLRVRLRRNTPGLVTPL